MPTSKKKPSAPAPAPTPTTSAAPPPTAKKGGARRGGKQTAPPDPLGTWREAKERHPGALLLFKGGATYRALREDAEVASKVLGITPTTFDNEPTCEFPHAAFEVNLRTLLRAGHRVAVLEQAPGTAKLAERVVLPSDIPNLHAPTAQEVRDTAIDASAQDDTIAATDAGAQSDLDSAPLGDAPARQRPIKYARLNIVEHSTTSAAGALTPALVETIMGWETESDYKARMVQERGGVLDSWSFDKPITLDDGRVVVGFHCRNVAGERVRCWNNLDNRPFDEDWAVEALCDSTILRGEWVGPLTCPGQTINGEAIRISRTGRVLTGQHQMTALKLAAEKLLASRNAPGYNPLVPKYPFWNGHDFPVLETIVITGLSDDERVVRTIDYVKPRSLADVLYTMPLYRERNPRERQDLTRMLDSALDLLWKRTAHRGYGTHPEMLEFLKRHRRLLQCVEHIFVENGETEDGKRRLSAVHLAPGMCAALCYMMGCGTEETTERSDEYRNEAPPSERLLDWGYWDRARQFWANLAASGPGWLPLRIALNQLATSKPASDDNQGLGGRAEEKLLILARAWEHWRDWKPARGAKKGSPDSLPFNGSANPRSGDLAEGGILALSYTCVDEEGQPLPEGQIKLIGAADFFGIDCPRKPTIATGTSRNLEQMDPPITREQQEQAQAEAQARWSDAERRKRASG